MELWADEHFKFKLDPPLYSAGGAGQMEAAGSTERSYGQMEILKSKKPPL